MLDRFGFSIYVFILSVLAPVSSSLHACPSVSTAWNFAVSPTTGSSIDFPNQGVAELSWEGIPGNGLYYVIVEDMTSAQTVAAFSTFSTEVTIGNVPSGHVCKFVVKKGSDYIIITEMATP